MVNLQDRTLQAASEVWTTDPEAIAFVLRQRQRLPDWLHIPFGVLVTALALSGWVKGRWFHELAIGDRQEILAWWQRHGGPGQDLVRLVHSLVVFGSDP
ncbi:MAG: hypothetical protein ACUVSQ_09900 [Pseudanabaenaceae cyanobacterium]